MPKVAISTQGCSHNFSDSEHMAGLLKKANYELVDEKDAEIVLLNTCTVKTPSEKDFLRKLKMLENQGKKIVLAGCVPQAEPMRFENYSIIGTRQLDNAVEAVDNTLKGNIIQFLRRDALPVLSAEKLRKNPVVEIVPISVGCLSACTFCKTKHARGVLQSYPVADIIDTVRKATSSGAKEIWLTSQDTGCYGFDKGANAAVLLKELCRIGKDFRIRLGMGNPDHIMKIKDELIDAFRDEKVFKFLHVPVQSGSDGILRKMKRNYTVEDFRGIISSFRSAFPEITISTDIIYGFPGETDGQFAETIRLLNEVKPDVVNHSRFWARPGTSASRMGCQLSGSVIKGRSRLFTKEFHRLSLERNQRWIGWEGEIVISEKGKNCTYVGRNFAYKPVVVNGVFSPGDKIHVRITGAERWHLAGIVN